MQPFKNNPLSVGVLLLGLAAVGWVALSWVEYSNRQNERYKQKETSDLHESIRQSRIQQCDAEAEDAAVKQYKDTFGGRYDYKEGYYLKAHYETAYQRCLRSAGID